MAGQAIKMIRKKKGLSQKDLAKACDIHITTMSEIENGGRYPTKEQRDSLAKFLDVPFEVLSFLSLDPKDVKDPLKDEFTKVRDSFANLIIGIV